MLFIMLRILSILSILSFFTDSLITDVWQGPKHVSVDDNNNHKPFYRAIKIFMVIINIAFSF